MKLKLVQKKIETPEVTSFIFEPTEPLSWQPGQFLHYVLHHEPTDERGSDRYFTNAAAPFENHVMITTRFAGEKSSSFKKKLFSLPEEKTIEMSVVGGDFLMDDLSKEYIWIAGGIGITPYRSILAQLDHEGKQPKITLLYANHDQNIVFKDELEEIAKRNPHFVIKYVFSPEHVDEAKIKELIPDFASKTFYVSGPEPMVDALGESLKKMGVPEASLKQDWFPGYPQE